MRREEGKPTGEVGQGGEIPRRGRRKRAAVEVRRGGEGNYPVRSITISGSDQGDHILTGEEVGVWGCHDYPEGQTGPRTQFLFHLQPPLRRGVAESHQCK